MPDLCACPGGDCPKKDQCLRYKITPGQNQTIFMNPPWDGTDCEHFLPMQRNDGQDARYPCFENSLLLTHPVELPEYLKCLKKKDD